MFLYLTKHSLQVNKEGGQLVINDNDTKVKRKIPFGNIEGVVIFGRIQLTTDVIRAFLKAKTPVFFLSTNGNYFGKLDSLELKNVELLYKHIEASTDIYTSFLYARIIIHAKVKNSITMLRRWARFDLYQQKELKRFGEIIEKLKEYLEKIKQSKTKWELRGYEGNAQKIYFEAFGMFLPKEFSFTKRTRRPPLDEINAMLSLGYTFLAQTIQMVLGVQGIEAQLGFFHKPKDLRTLLVLDMMEMYRAWIVDDLIIRVLAKGAIEIDDFFRDEKSESRPVLFSEEGLRKFIGEYHKTVFTKADEEEFGNYKKLTMIEKDIESFKQSIIKGDPEAYEGFKVK